MGIIFIVALTFFIGFLSQTIYIFNEYERAVVFRLGRLMPVKGPGLILVLPIIDKVVRVSLRTVAMDVLPQDVITKDNVTVKLNAIVFLNVIEPEKAIIAVKDFMFAAGQISQTALRAVVGKYQLDDLLAKTEDLNAELQKVIDLQTEPWGVKVHNVEVKNVDIPETMQRAMAKQAEAEREKRAKIIHAEGEFEASQKLAAAAKVIAAQPAALQLRTLGTLAEIAVEKNSTIVFPIPVDLISAFINLGKNNE